MRITHRYVTGPIFTLAVGGLALTGCTMAEPTTDQINEEFDGSVEHPTQQVCGGGNFTCKAHVVMDENNRIRPFALPAGLGPADLVSAYKLDPAITSTATIAIIDAFHYANAASDLATYRSTFGLPPCTVASGCLTIVNPTNAGAPPAGDDWNLEAALDLDMASAACPTCKLVLVEATNDQGNDLFNEQNTAAARAGVVSISNSWGGPSSASDTTFETFFNHTQNVNTFVSSGDSGNTGTTGDYPSTSAFVFAVGGTRLTKSTTAARGWTETAWTGAGSTCSRRINEPSFQTGTVPTAACTRRAASDISAVADPNSGVAVFNANDGGFVVVGGTSASAPFLAGVFARYGISGAGHNAAFAYSHKTAFFDVTSGRNGNCTSALCRAAAGWDGPTGLGSPNGAVLRP